MPHPAWQKRKRQFNHGHPKLSECIVIIDQCVRNVKQRKDVFMYLSTEKEQAKDALEKVHLLLGEILMDTSRTENTPENMLDLFGKRDRMNMFASIALDYCDEICSLLDKPNEGECA